MSKISNLLSKIDLFEKLAVSGRKQFLQSLAQGAKQTQALFALRDEIYNLAGQLNTNDQEDLGNQIKQAFDTCVISSDSGGVLADPVKPENLKELLSFLAQAATFYKNNKDDPGAAGDYNYIMGIYNKVKQIGPSNETSQTTKSQITPIDWHIQAALNALDGSPFSLVIDGKLGPKTRQALDWYKSKNTIATDAEAFETLLGKKTEELPKAEEPAPTVPPNPYDNDFDQHPYDDKKPEQNKQPGGINSTTASRRQKLFT